MTDTSDPSLVDTATLLASLRRDIGQASARIHEAGNFLSEAMVTAWELERRIVKPDHLSST
jgi:hypothetical protein